MQELINLMDYDFSATNQEKMKELIKELVSNFANTSKCEIEVNYLIFMIEIQY